MSDTIPAAPAAPAATSAPTATQAQAAPSTTTEAVQETSSTENASEGTLETAEQVAEAKKAVDSFKKKYNLKVNGKAKDLELDLSNDDEVQKYLQKAMAADEKFQEASTIRRQMEQLVDMLKTNPLSILKNEALGLDVRKLAEQVLNEEIEEMQKSPEQKRIEELERKLKDKEEREKQLEDERRQAEMNALQEQAAQQLDDQMSDAIGKSTLPKSPYVVKRLADAMIEAVNMGYNDVTPEQIMPFVEQQIMDEFQKVFEESADDKLEKLIGKKTLDRYRKGRVSKQKAQPIETAAQVKDSGEKSKEKKEEPKVRHKDMFKLF